jgi:hypothetical protein
MSKKGKIKLRHGDATLTVKRDKMVVKYKDSKIVIDKSGINIFTEERVDIKTNHPVNLDSIGPYPPGGCVKFSDK